MAAYVDAAIWWLAGRKWCHLLADDVDELHRFAAQLGLRRAHYQGPPRTKTPHYDLTSVERDRAIRLGAIPVSREKIVEVARKLRTAHGPAGRRDIAIMHADQIALDADVARAMISEQFPEYRDERIEPLGAAGTDHAIFRIGSSAAARFALRRADPEQSAKTLEREAAAMTEFATFCRVAAPRPIGFGRPGSRYPMPWLVQSWIEGDIATHDGLADSATFALDIANVIAALREAPTHGRRFAREGRGGVLADHDDWLEVCFRNSENLLDVQRLRQIWARLRELPPADTDVMNHGDLIPGNVLVRGERLVGVLDSGGFGPADPALDLVAAWHLLDRDRRRIVRDRLASTEAEWKRGAAWAFQQAMGLVWYYWKSNRAMSELGRSTLARILDDPAI